MSTTVLANNNGEPPLVAIIMPAFNAERWLAECLKSIFGQTLNSWELVFVDDGSIDSTFEIASRYASTDERIRIFRQPNKGVSAARNLALDHAKADVVAFFDADDVMYSNSLEQRLKVMHATGADVVYAAHDFLDEDSTVTKRCCGQDITSDPLAYLLESPGFALQTVLTRKSKVVEVGKFDESIGHGEDWDLWLKLAEGNCRFAYMPVSVNGYRIHGGSASNNRNKMLFSVINMLRKHRPSNDRSKMLAWRKGIYGVLRAYVWNAWVGRTTVSGYLCEIAKTSFFEPLLPVVFIRECVLRFGRQLKKTAT